MRTSDSIPHVKGRKFVRHAVTALLVITAPVWIIPFVILSLVFLIVSGMYSNIYTTLWGESPFRDAVRKNFDA